MRPLVEEFVSLIPIGRPRGPGGPDLFVDTISASAFGPTSVKHGPDVKARRPV